MNPGLGDCVRGDAARDAQAENRGDGDNAAAGSVPDHAARHGLRSEPDALEVGVDHLVPGLFVDVDRGARRRHAGVVHRHRHRPEPLFRTVEGALDAHGVGDVHDDAVRPLRAERLDCIGQGLRPTRAERDARARGGEHAGEVVAEPARRSGYENVLATRSNPFDMGGPRFMMGVFRGVARSAPPDFALAPPANLATRYRISLLPTTWNSKFVCKKLIVFKFRIQKLPPSPRSCYCPFSHARTECAETEKRFDRGGAYGGLRLSSRASGGCAWRTCLLPCPGRGFRRWFALPQKGDKLVFDAGPDDGKPVTLDGVNDKSGVVLAVPMDGSGAKKTGSRYSKILLIRMKADEIEDVTATYRRGRRSLFGHLHSRGVHDQRVQFDLTAPRVLLPPLRIQACGGGRGRPWSGA